MPVLAGAVRRARLWRRHIPAAVAALALAALAVALARPHATIAVPVERASVVLVTDASRSMLATDVEPSRMDAARSAAGAFLDGVPDELRVGAVGFSTTPSSVVPPIQDRERVRAHLATLQAGRQHRHRRCPRRGAPAARETGQEATARGNRAAAADGKTTTGRDPVDVAREARAAGVPVHTVALGHFRRDDHRQQRQHSSRATGPETMVEIARTSGGDSFGVDDGDQLDAVYERLGSGSEPARKKREITAGFAAGGMALLLAAAGLSLRAGGKLP